MTVEDNHMIVEDLKKKDNHMTVEDLKKKDNHMTSTVIVLHKGP
jgi:hypothetical protein